MENQIYDKLQSALSHNEIVSCAKDLYEFSTMAYSSKERTKWARIAHRDILSIAIVFSNGLGMKEPFRLFTGNHAVRAFLFLHVPIDLTPAKLFKYLIDFSLKLKLEFETPSGKHVSKSFIEEAVAYLNDKYSFFNKVYRNETPRFLLLNNSHRDFNSICAVRGDHIENMHYYAVLFNMRNNAGPEAIPEYVFLHELGHALQVSITGSIKTPPGSFRQYLAILNPNSANSTDEELCEVFADTFAMAVMYDKQFARYDPFDMISVDAKEICRLYVDKLMDTLC